MGSVGRGGSVGRRRNPFPVFGLLAPSRALRRTENPRVGGSIPPLATTSNFLKRNGFPASPADYRRARGRKSADHRTIGNRVGRAGPRRGAGGDLANWKPGTLGSARRGVGRVDAGPPLPGVLAWGALGRRPWPPPWPGGARPGCREGRDFGGCSPSARERMFHRESQPGCRRAPSRLVLPCAHLSGASCRKCPIVFWWKWRLASSRHAASFTTCRVAKGRKPSCRCEEAGYRPN